MKALVKSKAEPGLWLEDVEEPTVGPTDVLVRVKRAAICGTDVHIYNWDEWAQKVIKPPLTLGHEFMGEIVELGELVTDYQVGERVTAEGHIACGNCHACRTCKSHLCLVQEGMGVHRNGAFAELVSVPAKNLFRIPDSIEDELGAIMDPIGNAMHTSMSYPLAGEDLLITGAGPIGIMCVAIAKHVGARSITITDVRPERIDLAREMGADHGLNVKDSPLVEAMGLLDLDHGFGVGLEVSGHPQAFASMIETMSPGGQIALLGFLPEDTNVEWNKVLFKGLKIKGIYGRKIFETWYQMVAMLESGLDPRPIITHRFRLEEYQSAFELLNEGRASKIVLEIGE